MHFPLDKAFIFLYICKVFGVFAMPARLSPVRYVAYPKLKSAVCEFRRSLTYWP